MHECTQSPLMRDYWSRPTCYRLSEDAVDCGDKQGLPLAGSRRRPFTLPAPLHVLQLVQRDGGDHRHARPGAAVTQL